MKPNVSGDRLVCDDQSANRESSGNIQEGRVPTLVRGRVVGTECDRRGSAMVVNCQVSETAVTAVASLFANEVRAQHAVAALTGDIVDSVFGQKEVAREEPKPTGRSGYSSGDHGAMLVVVAREKMRPETSPDSLRHYERRLHICHRRSFNQTNTF
jgi:hypothetical protein